MSMRARSSAGCKVQVGRQLLGQLNSLGKAHPFGQPAVTDVVRQVSVVAPGHPFLSRLVSNFYTPGHVRICRPVS